MRSSICVLQRCKEKVKTCSHSPRCSVHHSLRCGLAPPVRGLGHLAVRKSSQAHWVCSDHQNKGRDEGMRDVHLCCVWASLSTSEPQSGRHHLAPRSWARDLGQQEQPLGLHTGICILCSPLLRPVFGGFSVGVSSGVPLISSSTWTVCQITVQPGSIQKTVKPRQATGTRVQSALAWAIMWTAALRFLPSTGGALPRMAYISPTASLKQGSLAKPAFFCTSFLARFLGQLQLSIYLKSSVWSQQK